MSSRVTFVPDGLCALRVYYLGNCEGATPHIKDWHSFSSPSGVLSVEERTGGNVRFATMNVLANTFPPFVELAIKSRRRMEAYTNREGYVAFGDTGSARRDAVPTRCRPFVDVAADVLCLNEVSLDMMASFCGIGESPDDQERLSANSSMLCADGGHLPASGDGGIMGFAGYRYAVFYGLEMPSAGPGTVASTLSVDLAPLVSAQRSVPLLARKHAHGCAIFSKFPITAAWRGSGSREVLALIDGVPLSHTLHSRQAPGTALLVCSRHTVAYATPATKTQRAAEIAQSAVYCRAIRIATPGCSAEGSASVPFILLGDLNLHDINEDSHICACGLVDVFAATNEQQPDDGLCDAMFTFDAVRNPMIPRYIPAEDRRMRLDRILLPKEFYYHQCVSDGDQTGVRYSFASLQRMWGVDLIAPELALSDHYGLAVDLRFHAVGTVGPPPFPSLHAQINPAVPYPGEEAMRARSLLPSDQSNRACDAMGRIRFWSKFAWVFVTRHMPWMAKEYVQGGR